MAVIVPLALLFLQCCQGVLAELTVRVHPKTAVVNPGESITYTCTVLTNGEVLSEKLEVCIFTIGGQKMFLRQNLSSGNIGQVGDLDKGVCGVQIYSVNETYNGNISCTVGVANVLSALEGYMSLTVAIPPQTPELEVTGADSRGVFMENESMAATCTVKNGRPTANISWYLDSERITEGLNTPVKTCTSDKIGLCTVQQNLTRVLRAAEDKKVLKCVASHYGYNGKEESDQYTISVNYPPKPASHPLEFFGLVEGKNGNITVTIEANPKPHITWFINDFPVEENTKRERYEVVAKEKAPGICETYMIIDTLTNEDTDQKYKIEATNTAGKASYFVSISTSPEPKVLELGAGLIIIIVAVILLILLVMITVWYTRTKGMFCFASLVPASPRIAGESSDTESADHTSDRKPKRIFMSVFKKRDKVATEKDALKSSTDSTEPRDVDKGDNVVYAELDLAAVPSVMVRGDDDKTEYAEIVHTKPSTK